MVSTDGTFGGSQAAVCRTLGGKRLSESRSNLVSLSRLLEMCKGPVNIRSDAHARRIRGSMRMRIRSRIRDMLGSRVSLLGGRLSLTGRERGSLVRRVRSLAREVRFGNALRGSRRGSVRGVGRSAGSGVTASPQLRSRVGCSELAAPRRARGGQVPMPRRIGPRPPGENFLDQFFLPGN